MNKFFILLIFVHQLAFSAWEVNNYVDEFGDKTNDKYIIYSTQGTFSNTATSNSKVFVDTYFSLDNGVRVNLHEYRLDSSPEKINGIIKIKNNKNEIFTSKISPLKKGGFFIENTVDFLKFFMRNEGEFKVVVENGNRSKYNFIIKRENFNEIVEKELM